MEKLTKYITVFFLLVGVVSCELFEAPNETENLTERLIDHPNIDIIGEQLLIYDIRNAPFPAYEDEGAVATFGPITDITDQIITTGVGDVDPNAPGFYDVVYDVSERNSLGQTVSFSATRTVLVLNPDDDATGLWAASAATVFGNAASDVTLTLVSTGIYQMANNVGIALGVIGLNGVTEIRIAGDVVIVPNHNLAPFSNNWESEQPGSEVLERDPVTDQITKFAVTWNSPQFGGGATFGITTFTRP